MSDQTAGLRTIVARGLFGSRDYEISVDAERPTVLTGANGTGKSTLLRLVNAVSSGNWPVLFTAPLDTFELHFEALPRFRLSLSEESQARLEWGESVVLVDFRSETPELPEWAVSVLESSPFLEGEELEEALSQEARALGLSYSEFREVADVALRENLSEALMSMPDWLDEMRSAFPVLFVTDQRLVVEEDRDRPSQRHAQRSKPQRRAVEAASTDIATQMRRVDSAYARASQTHDRRFPQEVIQAMTSEDVVSRDDLVLLVEGVNEKRESLRAVGLLEREPGFEPDLAAGSLEQEQVRQVISTFLLSTLRKLAVLEELASRLRAFKTFVDARFAGKTMLLGRRDGVQFQLSNGTVIQPAQLSSGEQQILVLAYEIIFRARDGTLVIVDEPEISLHVLWQDTLLDNLTQMGRAKGLQFLMATHSPVLLAAHPELERSLDATAA